MASKQEILREIDLLTLGSLVSHYLFGEQLDFENEDLFLTRELDETEALQAELTGRLDSLFEGYKLATPDRWVLQVFGRKSKSRPKEKLGEHAVAICLHDYQVIIHERKEHIVSCGTISPLFSMNGGSIPGVPVRTQVSLGKGKATVKPRNYRAILVWAFWNEYPVIQENTQDNEEAIQVESEEKTDPILF